MKTRGPIEPWSHSVPAGFQRNEIPVAKMKFETWPFLHNTPIAHAKSEGEKAAQLNILYSSVAVICVIYFAHRRQ